MNKFFIALLLLITNVTLSQQKVMNGFGELKLGMTQEEINQTFDMNISDALKNNLDYMRVTDNLILSDVRLTFENGRLIAIRCDYNEKLHNGLSQVYGQKNRYSTTRGILFEYKTNSHSTTCVSLYNKETIILNNELKNDLLFRRLNPAMRELNKVEGFDGL